jgi:hypothetical protein
VTTNPVSVTIASYRRFRSPMERLGEGDEDNPSDAPKVQA